MSETYLTKRLNCDPKTAEEAKRQLVLGSRILANEGVLDGLGHLSVRNPENPNSFFQSRSLAPQFITMDDIMEIGLDGTVIQGIEGKKPYGERVLHGAVMAGRADIGAVFHGHPIPVIPFTVCRDKPLLPVFNYGSLFYNGISFYDDSDVSSGGIVFSYEEGERISRCLGDRWACLMRGHGVVVAADNIPQAVIDTIFMVRNAEVLQQCYAMGGTPKVFSEEEGRAYRKATHSENALTRCWDYYVRRAKEAMPDIGDL